MAIRSRIHGGAEYSLTGYTAGNSERLRNLGTAALDTIEEIMTDKAIAPKDRLNAAVKILELGRVTTEPVQSTAPAKLRVKAMFDDLALLP